MKTNSKKSIARFGILLTFAGLLLFLLLRNDHQKKPLSTREIIAALDACPSWHRIGHSGNDPSIAGWRLPFGRWFTPDLKKPIERMVEDLARQDLKLLGVALDEYVEEKKRIDPHGNWEDNIELLNRYVFRVPPENLWPWSHGKEGKLELTGRIPFAMSFFGVKRGPADEFYDFWREYGRRPGTAPHGHKDTLPEGGIPMRGWRKLTEEERKRAFAD